MTVNYIVKLIETLGIPLAVALAGGVALWKLIAFVLKDLKSDIADKQDDLHAALRSQQVMLVRLIDRVRTLELNLQTTWTAALTALDAEPPKLRRTRAEVLAELKEQMLDVAHNGEADE